MIEAIKFLRAAVGAQSENNPLTGCYIIRDGMIYAQNGLVQAGVPFENSDTFNVPGKELEAALDRMKNSPSFAFEGNTLRIKSGRMQVTIQCLEGEPPGLAPPTTQEWLVVPETLITALNKALPFTDKTGQWTTAIRLSNGVVTAITNKCGIQIEVPELAIAEHVLVTRELVEFLKACDDEPVQYQLLPSALVFRWADGRWLRAQLMNTEMPNVVDNIFNAITTLPPIEVTADWRSAYTDVAAMADSVVNVTSRGINGERGHGFAEVEVPLDVAEEHSSRWATAVLDIMIPIASHWNPGAWPERAAFVGQGFKGVVTSVTR